MRFYYSIKTRNETKKLFFFLLVFTFSLSAHAQIPATLSYQGLLTDANGAPVSDGNTHTVSFAFYTQETGGAAVLTRGPVKVSTFKGLFTVILGNGIDNINNTNNAPLPSNLGDAQYWIEIIPDNGSPLSTRAILTSVPYAYRAQYANNVDGAAITSGTVPNERLNVNLQDLADGTLSGSKIGTGINASNITTGTLPAKVLPSTSGVPVGTIVAFGSGTPPSGWLECDGSAISRTTYSALFTAIGIAWGAGDATTTFNLPDLRGSFLRGWDHGLGNDPEAASRTAKFTSGAVADNVGSYQADAFQGHIHSTTFNTKDAPSGMSNYMQTAAPSLLAQYTYNSSAPLSDGSHGTPRTGSETRPKNANVAFIIKAQ